MSRFATSAAAAAVLLCACAGSRTTLDLEGLGRPEHVAALALLDEPRVVELAGDDARIVEETSAQLLDTGIPLLRDTRLPGTSRTARSAEYRVAGSRGEAWIAVDAERRDNGRWRVAKWSVATAQERDQRFARIRELAR